MIGQEHIETTLQNAILTGKVSHAYLFCGPRGTGKTTTARILAKALLCEKAPTDHPDGTCLACRQIADGIHPDVYELDAASRTGVENVREEIIGRVQFAPTQGAYKVYIIDEVHMLSTPAFNALLKTLEEPPSHVKFILCTTDPHKVPATIQSRCQRFDFRRLSEELIIKRLEYICQNEGYSFEPEALGLIAQRCAGGMRDAIGSLEQVAVFARGDVTLEAATSMLGEASAEQLFLIGSLIAQRDVAACFAWVAGFTQSGSDIARFASDLSVHVRNLYVAAVMGDDPSLPELLQTDTAGTQQYREQAQVFGSIDRLAYILEVLGELNSQLRTAANPRLALEIALTRLARPDADLTLGSLAARVAVLEAQQQQGVALGVDEAPVRSFAVPAKKAAEPAKIAVDPAAAAVAPVATATQPAATAGGVLVGDEPGFIVTQESVVEPLDDVPAGHEGAAEAGPLTQEMARGLLQQVKQALTKAKKLSVVAFLGEATAFVDPKGQGLVFELPSDAAFARQNLERADNRELVSELLEHAYGAPLAVSYVLGTLKSQASKGSPAPVPEPEPEPEPEPVLEPAAEPAAEPVAPRQEEEQAAPEQNSSLSFEEMLSASFGTNVQIDEVGR